MYMWLAGPLTIPILVKVQSMLHKFNQALLFEKDLHFQLSSHWPEKPELSLP